MKRVSFKTDEKTMEFFINPEQRIVVGKTIEYRPVILKNGDEAIERVPHIAKVQCSEHDVFDPLIGIAIAKLKLDTKLGLVRYQDGHPMRWEQLKRRCQK